MDDLALRHRHGIAGLEQQLADVLARVVYSAELSALALEHRDIQGAFYWFYGAYKDVMTGSGIVRELRDGEGAQ